MKKTYLLTCAKRRLKSACASAQSDQSHRCPHEETMHPWLSKCAKRVFWSHYANARADLNHRWCICSKTCFLTLLMYIFTGMHYSKTCVREPPSRLILNSGWCGKRCLSYKGTCHVILLAKLHDMFFCKTSTFPHQPLKSISKVAVLHRFYCIVSCQCQPSANGVEEIYDEERGTSCSVCWPVCWQLCR